MPEAQIVDAAPSTFVEPAPAASSIDPLPTPIRDHKVAPKSKARLSHPKEKEPKKKGGTISNRIEYIIEASKLPPAEQALLPKKHLTTKVARPKKGQKNKNGGIEPILEHNDIKDDPYYMKPPLPTRVK